jgi:hypothetical protein
MLNSPLRHKKVPSGLWYLRYTWNLLGPVHMHRHGPSCTLEPPKRPLSASLRNHHWPTSTALGSRARFLPNIIVTQGVIPCVRAFLGFPVGFSLQYDQQRVGQRFT